MTNSSSSTGADASGMDPALLAYYQSMSYYSMMQGMTGATLPGAGNSATSTATDSTASNNTTPGLQISSFCSPVYFYSPFFQQPIQRRVNLITANNGLNIIDLLDRTMQPIKSRSN